MDSIVVYGKPDCVDFLRSKALLDRLGIPFVFRDIIGDEEAEATARNTSGGTSSPVIVFGDGTFQIEPSDAELAIKLGQMPPADSNPVACEAPQAGLPWPRS